MHKHHKLQPLGPIGIQIMNESQIPERLLGGQILKKELFFKNLGEDIELTVYPFKQPWPLQEFQSTYVLVPKGDKASVYFHFLVPNEPGEYENQFRFFCKKRFESFGAPIVISFRVHPE